MSVDIEVRVKKVMGNVFGINSEEILPDSSLDTVEKWNSLGHMNLVIALEEEFNIQFSDQQTIEMMNYPLIVCVVKESLAGKQ